jgi:phosphate transport system substrate-binding protein
MGAFALLAVFLAGCAPKTESGTAPSGEGTTKNPSSGATIVAMGSTFVQPFLSRVFSEYKTKTGFQVNYTGGGSGQGVTSVIDGAAFGASDAPMSDEEMQKAGREIVNIPIVLGTVAIVYNVPGLESGLKFDGALLADIFMGKVQNWNDRRIAALNPGVTLPNQRITVQVRADGSGTTFVLSDFLAAVSPDWKDKMGVGKKLTWGPHAQQWPKSDGVASNTKSTPGSISYVELTWAKRTGLSYGAVKNKDGEFVLPNPEGATAAAAALAADMPADFRVSIVNAPGPESYPISSFVFGMMPTDLSQVEHGRAIRDAIIYTITEGQRFAGELDYAPLPTEVADRAKAALEAIKVG